MPRKDSQWDDNDNDDVSQHSKAPDSDDRELELYAKAVAEFKVSWKKQKRERERRCLKNAQLELDDLVNRKTAEIEQIMAHMEDLYQDFASRYAAIEDKKREVIAQIADKQKTLLAMSVKKHQEAVELVHDLEEGQREGIKLVAQTCQDMQAMIDGFMKG